MMTYNNDTNIWLECLSTLHKSQMRKAAAAECMQLVHFEILQYLSICNKYSNTAQCLSEYLGQTKGSISQSLKFIEKMGYIEKKPDPKDKRFTRLFLTNKGKACQKRMNQNLMPSLNQNTQTTKLLQDILHDWQQQNDLTGYGQCKTCRFNNQLKNDIFWCELIEESLSIQDIQLICKEHQFTTRG